MEINQASMIECPYINHAENEIGQQRHAKNEWIVARYGNSALWIKPTRCDIVLIFLAKAVVYHCVSLIWRSGRQKKKPANALC
jgi:hypothetical protein